MSVSTYLRRALLGHAFGGDAMTLPTEWWVQLHDGEPGVDCAYSALVAVPREQLSLWTIASDGYSESDDLVHFASVAETCNITHISIWDAETAGSPLLYCRLTSPSIVLAGEDASFTSSSITATVTGLANYTANKFLGLACNVVPWTQPTEWWAQLHDGNPGASYADNILGGTARQSVTWDAVDETQYTHPRTGIVYHIVYVQSDIEQTWSNVQQTTTITHITFWDSETGGNCLYSKELTTGYAVIDGQSVTIAANWLAVSMTETYDPDDIVAVDVYGSASIAISATCSADMTRTAAVAGYGQIELNSTAAGS